MARIENVSRRGLLKGMAIGSGLILGLHIGRRWLPVAEAAPPADFAPGVYVSIDNSGLVTIFAHRSEMGTGIRTGLPMVLADELEADWAQVRIVQARGDAKYGDQNTDGSRSMRQFYEAMREAGAAARQMLETAAAEIWDVPATECHALNHAVIHAPSQRRLPFAALVAVAATLPVPPSDHEQLRFKDPKARRYIGRPMPITDLDDIICGRAAYGIDTVLPGMKYASVARCPVYGGTVKSFDAHDALAVA
ncbi:MAG: molybdopterin-dependent oxidoreductase, partial [Alphaproteobacteria bacterium]|nr:molybdopterin-dependent oxidoreductase [Alphaproteobacteria bacterium]